MKDDAVTSEGEVSAVVKRGRRAGSSGTRQAILDAARTRFAREGYGATTIRKVATDAGVNPALVMQFFSSKEELFAAVLSMPAAALSRIAEAFDGSFEGLGERVTRAFLVLWEEDAATSEPLLALIRATVSNEQASAQFSEFVQARLVDVISPRLPDGPETAARAGFAAAMLVGLMIGRRILRVPAIAEVDHAAVVRLVGPTIQQIFTPTPH